jgi:hypothetical protein
LTIKKGRSSDSAYTGWAFYKNRTSSILCANLGLLTQKNNRFFNKSIPLSFWQGMPCGGGGLNRPQEQKIFLYNFGHFFSLKFGFYHSILFELKNVGLFEKKHRLV